MIFKKMKLIKNIQSINFKLIKNKIKIMNMTFKIKSEIKINYQIKLI